MCKIEKKEGGRGCVWNVKCGVWGVKIDVENTQFLRKRNNYF